MIIGNMLIGQSGGPTAVINSSLAGAIKEGLNNPCIEKVYGAINGVAGILEENLFDFTNETNATLVEGRKRLKELWTKDVKEI